MRLQDRITWTGFNVLILYTVLYSASIENYALPNDITDLFSNYETFDECRLRQKQSWTDTGTDCIKDLTTTSCPGMLQCDPDIKKPLIHNNRKGNCANTRSSSSSAGKVKDNKDIAQPLKDFGLRISKLLVRVTKYHFAITVAGTG